MKDKNITYRDYQTEDFFVDESFISWVNGSQSQVEWEEVFEEYPHLVPIADEAIEIILKMGFSEKEIDHQRIAAIKRKIDKRIENKANEANVIALYDRHEHHDFRRDVGAWRWAAGIAAGIAVFVGVLLWQNSAVEVSEIPQITLLTKTAQMGQKLTTRLSDGTIVVLNSGSRIEYEEIFNDTARIVTLEGEAFFDVTKDSRPFRVKSNGTVTTALGTSFNIKQEKEQVSISLVTGKVGVNMVSNTGMKESTLLVPGEQVVVDVKDSIKFVKGKFNESDVLAWKRGVLSFRNSTKEEVCQKLEKWYGVEIVIENPAIKKQAWDYTGSFDNESLENVLESIAFVKGFQFVITGDRVKIY